MAPKWDPSRPTLGERSGARDDASSSPPAAPPAPARPAPAPSAAAPPDPAAVPRRTRPAEPDPGRPRPLGTRHCWLTGLPDLPGRHAGLVVEWRRDDARPGWLARVVYTVDDAGSPVLVEAWIPAGHLTPAS